MYEMYTEVKQRLDDVKAAQQQQDDAILVSQVGLESLERIFTSLSGMLTSVTAHQTLLNPPPAMAAQATTSKRSARKPPGE